MKAKSQERGTLDRLRFDALDAVDVEEVVLVIIRDEALHLLRAHASVRLRDVNRRRVEVGKDVDARAAEGDDREDDHRAGKHDDRDGSPQRESNEPHRAFT
jgi:hypothetical protein